MAEVVLSLDQPLSSESISQIDLFRVRFRELWENWESLKRKGINLGGSFSNHGGGAVSGPGCGIETHRLKGFYLDFRFFWGQREPTYYFTVSALLGRHCSDTRLRKVLTRNKQGWKDAGVLHEWHGIHADEMINAMFNGQLFHSDVGAQSKLAIINEAMSDELANHLLTSSIYNRMLVIRNLNWIMEPLSLQRQEIRLPEEAA